jgi:integrase
MPKAQKGTVSISVADGRLRLRWMGKNAQGGSKRYTLAAGIENATNRLVAERLAKEIELDLHSGNFDYSLRKYRIGVGRGEGLEIGEFCDRYSKSQISPNQSSSLERYRTLRNHLQRCFGEIEIDEILEKQAHKFLQYLQNRDLKGETINLYLTLLRGMWVWAIKRGLVQVNPWLEMEVDTEPSPGAKPFTLEEIAKILKGFEDSEYEDFVRFLLGVGCRIGEAVALQWEAVSVDCAEIWIGKAWDSKGRRIKATKTNKARTVPVSPKIQEMLQSKREGKSPQDFVFTAPKGGLIDSKNFLNRHWKPLLKKLEIPYRPPYNSRHTRWSHEIANGMDIATAAAYAGNRPRTMLDRYYGQTNRPRLKDF